MRSGRAALTAGDECPQSALARYGTVLLAIVIIRSRIIENSGELGEVRNYAIDSLAYKLGGNAGGGFDRANHAGSRGRYSACAASIIESRCHDGTALGASISELDCCDNPSNG